MKNICAIIFAGCKGSKMNNSSPKVLLKLADQPIIFWILRTLKNTGINQIVTIIGYQSKLVKETILKEGFVSKFVEQKELLGTANSLQVSFNKVPKDCTTLLVLFGDDSAFYKPETIKDFINYHIQNKNKGTFLTSYLDEPNPIGGLNLDSGGHVLGVMRQSEIVKSKLKKG